MKILLLVCFSCIIATSFAVAPFKLNQHPVSSLVQETEYASVDIPHFAALLELRQKLETTESATEKNEIQMQIKALERGQDDAVKNEAVQKWNGMKDSPDKFTKFRLAMRAFISTTTASPYKVGGFWLDSHCGRGDHEYVGHVPRIADLNGNECYRTDSREYSNNWDARARMNHKFDITSTVNAIRPYSDETVFYICEKPTLFASLRKQCGDRTCTKTSSPSYCVNDAVECYDGSSWSSCAGKSNPKIVYVRLHGAPKDPCTPPGTPAIDYNAQIYMMPYKGYVSVRGGFDDFPWMEVVAFPNGASSGTNIVRMDPHGGLFSLIGGAPNRFAASKQF